MRNKKFFCFGCDRIFDTPEYYDESHGLDNPPYERVPICPECKSDDFITFDTMVDKDTVAEKILPAIAALNRLSDNLNDVFGSGMDNDDLSQGIGLLVELVCEMFYFMDVDIEKRLMNMSTNNDVDRVLMYMKGELLSLIHI